MNPTAEEVKRNEEISPEILVYSSSFCASVSSFWARSLSLVNSLSRFSAFAFSMEIWLASMVLYWL